MRFGNRIYKQKKRRQKSAMSLTKKFCNEFKPFLSPLAVIAFAIGTSIGWGSFVVTNNTYLKQAGPLESIIGLLIGAAIMFCMPKLSLYSE